MTEAGSSADVDAPVLGSDDHPIIETVIKEDTKLLTILLRAGCSPNVTDSKGQTALFIASKSGHTDVVAKLLAHDADVTAKDHESSRTALEEVESLLVNLRMNNPQYDAGNAKLLRSLQVVATTLEMATKKAEEALEAHKEKQYGELEYANDLMILGATPREDAENEEVEEAEDEGEWSEEEDGTRKGKVEKKREDGEWCFRQDLLPELKAGGLSDDEIAVVAATRWKNLQIDHPEQVAMWEARAAAWAEKPASLSQAAWGVMKSWDFGLFVFEKEKNAPRRKELHEANEAIKDLLEEREDEWT
jgi:hypothetical protein